MLCFRNSPAAKRIMDKRGGITISRQKLFVLHCRTLSQGNLSLLCFRNFLVARKIMDKKRVSRSSVESFFLSDMPENFAAENFCAVFQKISGRKKLYG